MAIQNIKCPTCGGEVQLDDNLEKGFCMYCGGAIQIQEEVEKIKIEHSGKVEIDDSKKMANSIELADRAFDSGNYEECYNYCCSALECDINNFRVIFRKGLCAAYLSIFRAPELVQAISTTLDIIVETSDHSYDDIHSMFDELFEYIKTTYELECNHSKGYAYPDLESANNTFAIVAALTNLSSLCSDLISSEMMNERPDYESDKKACLEQGLKLSKLGVSSFKYFVGYRQVKRGDRYVNEEVYESTKSPHLAMQKNLQNKLKTEFNNLPSTQKALGEYEIQIAELQKDIDAFTNKLEEYFKENPKISKEYKRKTWPFIVMASLFLPATLTSGQGLSSASGVLDVIPIILAMGICLFLGVFALVKIVGISKKRKEILNSLPPYLMDLKITHDQSKIKLQTVNSQKAAFIKENIKK